MNDLETLFMIKISLVNIKVSNKNNLKKIIKNKKVKL